ncbi:MAG: hypothetical protein ACYSWX_11095 [Planctomycetota bacterium]|jgi:hypothetical protein
MPGQGQSGNVIAAICSFFIPGLGQLVQGRLLLALFLFASIPVIYFLAFPTFFALLIGGQMIGAVIIPLLFLGFTFVLHLWSIVDAARWQGPA